MRRFVPANSLIGMRKIEAIVAHPIGLQAGLFGSSAGFAHFFVAVALDDFGFLLVEHDQGWNTTRM